MITPEERENIFEGIWSGVITVFALPVILFRDTWQQLQKGMFRGYGGNFTDFSETSTDFAILTRLNENLNRFSAAKTFQNVSDTQNFVLDAGGNLRPFTEFRKDALKIFDQYNENWLRTEFETTVAGAQSAVQWKDIQRDKEILPLLKYQTAGDEKVRPQHAAWDGIVKPVNDPFWDTHNPPNGFNCRCIAIQLEKGEEKVTNLSDHLKKVKEQTEGEITTLENDSKIFNINPGKRKIIFPDKGVSPHPYFKVDETFEILKQNNFNLPLA